MRKQTETRARKKARGELGMSLLEMMIVLAIMALVATIAAPRLINQLSRAKSQAATVEIDAIAQSLEYYNLELGRYPGEEEGLKALQEAPPGAEFWNGPYMDAGEDGLRDPWDRPYQYRYPGEHGAFDVYSLGADGEAGGDGENRDVGNWM